MEKDTDNFLDEVMKHNDVVDYITESPTKCVKIFKEISEELNNTIVHTKEDLKKSICELIDTYYI